MAQPETQVNLSSVELPPRKGRLETYLWDYGNEVSADNAEDLYNPYQPIQGFGVLIPVAAHQESGRILPAMAEYAAQDGADPFSIFLYLNAPNNAASEDIQKSVAAVHAAQQAYPSLDIRYTTMQYETPVIGQIRKDLWDAVMRLALADGIYDSPSGEFVGINHDIDTEKIGRHYIRNVQGHYKSLQAGLDSDDMTTDVLPVRLTQVKHAYPFATHPNIAKAIFWSDFTYRQQFRHGIFENGMVIPLSYYVKKGGFDHTAITHESHKFSERSAEGIPGTAMDTSPRRYITRLNEPNITSIWTNESFSSDDACRDPSIQSGDITHDSLEKRIFETLETDVRSISTGGITQFHFRDMLDGLITAAMFGVEDYKKAADELEVRVRLVMEPRFRLAKMVLERVVGSPLLSDLVDESFQYRAIKRQSDMIKLRADMETDWLR